MSRPVIVIAASTLLPVLAACTSWSPATVGPVELIDSESPDAIRVNRTDGTSVVIDDPRIEGDSIVGVERRCRNGAGAQRGRVVCGSDEHVGVSLDDAETIDLRRTNSALTAAAVLLTVSVAAVAAMASAGSAAAGRALGRIQY